MPSNRWEEINRLYNAAVEVEETERISFLEKACGEDAELRREVESLLAYDQQAQPLLDRPALQVTAEKLAAEPASLLGRKLGPYQIQVLLGSGGMGEVYRARDTRLNRTVAIKVLPRHLLERSDLRQRFEREARAIASLDHPHICALYDIGHEGATDFLVMQYLDGETLSQRLRKGPLPTEEVLRYAIEIAGALNKAHRQGVIHRDLKPGNIMLTETGAKLLDFGLAKQSGRRPPVGDGSPIGDSLPLSKTQSESLTEQGMILGTLEYMAPEQLEGKEADARTDIFALGVVIYEMATGRKAFEGDSKASVIAKILTFQPSPIRTIQPVSPPELDPLVRRCLAKKPEERWQSAAELTGELREIAQANLPALKVGKSAKAQSGEPKEIDPEPKPAFPLAIPEPQKFLSLLIHSQAWKFRFAGILLVLIIGSLVVWQLGRQPQKPLEKSKEMSVRPLTSYASDNPLDYAAISPDGKYLAFCSKKKLFIQVIRSGEKRSVALPEGFDPVGVSWFADGTKLLLRRAEERWFQVKGQPSRQPEESLWSLSILGGSPQKVVDHAAGAFVSTSDAPSVSPDGSLVAFNRIGLEGQTVELWVVGADGEEPRRIRAPSQPNQGYFGSLWSSNGQRLFYFRDVDDARSIESCDLRGEQVTNIFPSKTGQKYVWPWEAMHSLCWAPDGRILFSMQEKGPVNAMRGGEVFNLWEIKVDAATGRPLSEGRQLTQWTGFSTSQVNSLSITADGKQLVVVRANLQADVYVAEAEQGGRALKNLKRLTLMESNDAVWDWTADSRAVLFESDRNGNRDLFKQDISQADAETIVASPQFEWHPSLSPDGAFILYLVSEKSDLPKRLLRVPVGGGPPELVLSGEKIKNFSCAHEANLCVVVEEVDGKQILTTFDPLKGRGEQLLMADYPYFGSGILSPQGRLIEKMKSAPEGLQIRVRSLTGRPPEEITFKNLTGAYSFLGWSLDGKGFYLQTSGFTCVYAGLDAHSQVLWKRGSGPVWAFGWPIPSPNGQYLASTILTYESNAWMLENF